MPSTFARHSGVRAKGLQVASNRANLMLDDPALRTRITSPVSVSFMAGLPVLQAFAGGEAFVLAILLVDPTPRGLEQVDGGPGVGNGKETVARFPLRGMVGRGDPDGCCCSKGAH